ncbi:MAG: aspartate aminotransferase, partial [Planctomycetota bacterium]
QRGLARALGLDVSANVTAYEAKRDLVERVLGPVADMAHPGGAFYAFIKVPTEVAASATEFVERAIERNVLLIPGCVFSSRDTHLRLSYAVPDESLETGLRILAEMLAR